MPIVGGELTPILPSGHSCAQLALGRGPLAGAFVVLQNQYDQYDVVSFDLAIVRTDPPVVEPFADVPGTPLAMTTAPDGTTYVSALDGSSAMAVSLYRFTPDGDRTTFATSSFHSGASIAVDESGFVYWAVDNGINQYGPDGSLLSHLPGALPEWAREHSAFAASVLSFGPAGDLYGLDNYRCRYVFRYRRPRDCSP
jgi:hypothetical protein